MGQHDPFQDFKIIFGILDSIYSRDNNLNIKIDKICGFSPKNADLHKLNNNCSIFIPTPRLNRGLVAMVIPKTKTVATIITKNWCPQIKKFSENQKLS